MTEIPRSRSHITWLLLEGLVVVASILLAFWIDAWWNARQQRILERTYLEAMREDVVATIDENLRISQMQEREVEAARSLVELIGSNAELPNDIRNSFFVVVLPAETMDTYRDLVASGNTTNISSLAVRKSMANLMQVIEYNDRGEQWAMDLQIALRILLLEIEPGEMDRQRLGEIWFAYLDAGERLLRGKKRLIDAANNALDALDSEIRAN